jgi:hypothetical protein
MATTVHATEIGRYCRNRASNRIGIGFWIGGALFGIGGCILGFGMPYHHPVAVVISMLWWGIYCGCFGASVGALAWLVCRGGSDRANESGA